MSEIQINLSSINGKNKTIECAEDSTIREMFQDLCVRLGINIDLNTLRSLLDIKIIFAGREIFDNKETVEVDSDKPDAEVKCNCDMTLEYFNVTYLTTIHLVVNPKELTVSNRALMDSYNLSIESLGQLCDSLTNFTVFKYNRVNGLNVDDANPREEIVQRPSFNI